MLSVLSLHITEGVHWTELLTAFLINCFGALNQHLLLCVHADSLPVQLRHVLPEPRSGDTPEHPSKPGREVDAHLESVRGGDC